MPKRRKTGAPSRRNPQNDPELERAKAAVS